jgi:hypothetical protein
VTIGDAPAQGAPWGSVTAEAVLAGCDVEVVDLSTRLSAADRKGAGALAAFLRAAPPASGPPRVQVRVVDRPPAVPPTVPASPAPCIETWRTRPGLLVIRHEAGVAAHATADEIVIGGTAGRFEPAFRQVLVLAIAHLLSRHGRQVTHGGAVALDGRAVLLLGGTGSGKSTLALCARHLGWRILSDDLVAVQLRDAAPWVAAVPRPLAIPVDALDPDAPLAPMPHDQRRRCELPPDDVSAGWYPVAGSLLAAHGEGSHSHLDELDGPERLRLVFRSSAPLGEPAFVRRTFALAGAVARRPGLVLSHGTDPRMRVAEGTRLLELARVRLGLPRGIAKEAGRVG